MVVAGRACGSGWLCGVDNVGVGDGVVREVNGGGCLVGCRQIDATFQLLAGEHGS